MLLLLKSSADAETIKKAAEDLDGYIKFVVDIEKSLLTVGGRMHVEGEQLLLQEGSKQENLWGGGYDLETGELDFESMINIRPQDNNPSREVLSPEIREQITKLVNKFLKSV